MPLPVLHSYCGYSVYRAAERNEVSNAKLVLLCAVLANLADLDFIPGLFFHDALRFHHGLSHSLGASILAGLAAGLFFSLGRQKPLWKSSLLFGSVYFSQVILDFLFDRGGVPMLWPFSSVIFSSPFFSSALVALAPAVPPIHLRMGLFELFDYFATRAFLNRFLLESVFVTFLSSLVHLVSVPAKKAGLEDAAALAGVCLVLVFLWSFAASLG